jgi:hypothetical protein
LLRAAHLQGAKERGRSLLDREGLLQTPLLVCGIPALRGQLSVISRCKNLFDRRSNLVGSLKRCT